jgi:type IV secretion system protein VirB10
MPYPLGEVSTEMVRRNMQIQPRIEVRAGYRYNVFVNRDLLMPGPYAPS